ncbi:MAG: hypothetical protein Q9161_005771 [Pseudevernia consocians]
MPSVDDGYIQTWRERRPGRGYLDPKDAPAEIFVEREKRQVHRSPGIFREQRIVELDNSPRQHRDRSPSQPRPSRSANPQRRQMVLARKGRRRDESSDSDTDYETDGSSPRRIRNRKHYNKDLPVAPAGPIYPNPLNRSRSMEAPRSRSQGPPRPPGRRGRYHSDSDSSSSDENGEKKAKPKPAPKQILYTGLACVATLAAANNIYQSAKAHHTRQRELEEGEITSAEEQKLKMQARKMDLISLGVAAVGAYNVKNGWKRAEGHWKAHKESQAEGRR